MVLFKTNMLGFALRLEKQNKYNSYSMVIFWMFLCCGQLLVAYRNSLGATFVISRCIFVWQWVCECVSMSLLSCLSPVDHVGEREALVG